MAVVGLVLAGWLGAEKLGSAGNNRASTEGRGARGNGVATPIPSAGDETRKNFDEVIALARKSLAAIQEVPDYTAVLTTTELIDGRMLHKKMQIKFRREPFSAYLRCRSKPDAGREVIYVAGANDGKLLAHEGGIKRIVGTLKLKPDDPEARSECRYPITEIGIEKMTESTIAAWEYEQKNLDPAIVDIQFFATAVHGPTSCSEVQITHTRHEPGIEFQVGRLYFDKQTNYLIEAEQYGWPKDGEQLPLVEHYDYSDIRVNVGLTDEDFDPQNPNYRF